jgi:hypothetical protein
MTEQAENERPFAFKRERRQSKGFQNLIQKEVVSKSPFKVAPSNDQDVPPSPPKPVPTSPLARGPIPASPTLEPSEPNTEDVAPTETPELPPAQPTPTRSSLVSRRMHGPRSSASGKEFGGKRSRRKTVTFDERCDVVEFEPDEDEQSDDGFEDGNDEELGSFEDPDDVMNEGHAEEPDDSYEGIPLDAERSLSFDSISNLSRLSPMHQSSPTSAGSFSLPVPARPPTPPRQLSQPAFTERETRLDRSNDDRDDYEDIPLGDGRIEIAHSMPTQSTPPSTPPCSRFVSSMSEVNNVPLRKSTHAERIRSTPDVTDPELKLERDVPMLPPSPSPFKGRKKTSSPFNENELAAKLGLRFPTYQGILLLTVSSTVLKYSFIDCKPADDPFAIDDNLLPLLKDESLVDFSLLSRSGDSIEVSNASIQRSEVSITGIGVPLVEEGTIAEIVAPPGDDTSCSSCESRGASGFV